MEKISFGDDVTCRPHNPLDPSSLSLPVGYRDVLEPEPCPDRVFFHPSFAPIFFQLLPPSRGVLGLVAGDASKPMFDIGGVCGGVIGSNAVVEGDAESVLSSVILSGPSTDDVPDDPER
jgi:hypothetical protein